MIGKSPARLAACGAFLWATGLLMGCAANSTKPDSPTDCHRFYQQFERAVSAAGAADAGSWRIAGAPRFRTNRLLAQLASPLQDQPFDSPGWQRWLSLSGALAKERQQAEWQRLSPVTRQTLAGHQSLTAWQTRCAAAPQVSAKALARGIPDEYSTLQRLLGVYPLTQLGPKLGLQGLRQRFVDDFSQPLSQLRSDHPLQRYSGPAGDSLLAAPLQTDALGLPQPTDLGKLFNQHAPLWEVETAGSDDIPSSLRWDAATQSARADTEKPAEYRFISYGWFNGGWRLQLNYQLWFPARSASHPLDILAGRLDGLIWRVTLDNNRQPLVFDSIHPCGCYHITVPTRGFVARTSGQQLPEPPIVLPAVAARSGWKLRVSAGEHQLRGLALTSSAERRDATLLVARPYSDLLTLPTAGGQARSAFRTDGLVNQTDRAERFLLWPMGIRSAGAMRQAGRQPIAFVGKRHFDDWNLLDTILQPAPR